MAAQRLSHHYAGRIASIPLPPPSPPPKIRITPSAGIHGDPSPLENGHDLDEQGRLREERRRRLDAEDAALELERSVYEDVGHVLDDSLSVPSSVKLKGKGKEAAKRLVPSAESDSGSDLEIPRKGDSGGPAHKKRKIDKDAASVADDFERSMVDAPLTLKVPGPKSKGKGKQTREPTPDSVSATPKAGRRKPGPKKKFGLAPELEAEITSHPPSVAGDATPAYSRPVSPAPTISSVVYDLDESIPPLKKAKKIDDAAMMKRVKSLEEAQRKVWTNIAKRDIAKVSTSIIKCVSGYSGYRRSIAICFQDTKLGRHNWNVLREQLQYRLESPIIRIRKHRKTSRPRLSVSCAKCRCCGKRTRRRNAMFESVSRRKPWIG